MAQQELLNADFFAFIDEKSIGNIMGNSFGVPAIVKSMFCAHWRGIPSWQHNGLLFDLALFTFQVGREQVAESEASLSKPSSSLASAKSGSPPKE